MRSHLSNLDEIKDRAIVLLQSGGIEGRSVDDLRCGERCTLNWAIRQALQMAIEEVRKRDEFIDRRRAVLRRAEYNRAVKEITQFVLSDRPSPVKHDAETVWWNRHYAGELVARRPIEPVEHEYRFTQKLLDLFEEKNGKPVETTDELIAWINASPPTMFSVPSKVVPFVR